MGIFLSFLSKNYKGQLLCTCPAKLLEDALFKWSFTLVGPLPLNYSQYEGIRLLQSNNLGPLHVLWQVSFGCWVTWTISSLSWQKYYKSVFFPKAKWWVAELLFLSLNNWGLNFLQNECSQFSQIYLLPEKLRKMFTFQSCKFSDW